MEENIKKCIHNHSKDYTYNEYLDKSYISKADNTRDYNINCSYNNSLHQSSFH